MPTTPSSFVLVNTIASLAYSFSFQLFTDHLLCGSHCVRHKIEKGLPVIYILAGEYVHITK